MLKARQKYWLYFLVFFGITHLIRDILQDTGINSLLSDTLVKRPVHPAVSRIVWTIFNTYLIAILEIGVAIFCLKRDSFGKLGYASIFIFFTFLSVWLGYWFFL